MSTDITGTGWDFPIGLDADGRILRDRGDETVSNAIWLILSTAPGERVMRPDFGCGIHGLVFAPGNASTAGVVAHQVRQALIRWEPRIDVQDVQVASAADNPAVLLIRIGYRVRSTNNVFNLVYPLYLERGVD